MSANPDINLPRRRDEEGDFHQLEADSCSSCGCTIYRAVDDRELIWEPGSAWDESCSNRDCHCHMDPVIGLRKS